MTEKILENQTASSLREISSCEVCGNTDIYSVLNLGTHPMCDDLVPVNDSRGCKEYPIEILFCENCLTGHQRFQIFKHELFPPDYHYRARHTADVVDGMKQLVLACEAMIGNLANKKVLDVGCNDGSLLSIFRDNGAHTLGIEPTGAFEDAQKLGHHVLNKFFSEDLCKEIVSEHGQPDIITFTNAFAHIDDLPEIIRSLKVLTHKNTIIVIENHYLGSILEKHQFDTFYHEHPRTYSYTSFAHVADSLEMQITKVEFPKRYGGNIRVFIGRGEANEHHRWSELHESEKIFGNKFYLLAKQIESWRSKKTTQIDNEINRYGKLCAKAFPGRAAIPVKLLGLDERHISAVYEKPLSAKIGHYVPGTRIPILSDEKLPMNVDPILNFAWHISSEIAPYLQKQGYRGRIIDIISAEDFSE